MEPMSDTTMALSTVATVTTAVAPVAGAAAGPGVWLSYNTIQVARSTSLNHDYNNQTENLLTDSYAPFGMNFDFQQDMADGLFGCEGECAS